MFHCSITAKKKRKEKRDGISHSGPSRKHIVRTHLWDERGYRTGTPEGERDDTCRGKTKTMACSMLHAAVCVSVSCI